MEGNLHQDRQGRGAQQPRPVEALGLRQGLHLRPGMNVYKLIKYIFQSIFSLYSVYIQFIFRLYSDYVQCEGFALTLTFSASIFAPPDRRLRAALSRPSRSVRGANTVRAEVHRGRGE